MAYATSPLAYALADGHKPAAGAGQSVVQALHEARGERSFHYLFWGYFVCGFQTAFIMLHLPSFLVDAGFSANIGMTAVALIYGLHAVAILVFLLLPLSTATAWAFAAVMGLLWLGTVPLTNGLIAQIFGLRYMSMLTGVVFLGHQLGAFLGIWLGGRVFDETGSYDMAWLIAIGLSLVAALCSWPIDEKPLVRQGAVA